MESHNEAARDKQFSGNAVRANIILKVVKV